MTPPSALRRRHRLSRWLLPVALSAALLLGPDGVPVSLCGPGIAVAASTANPVESEFLRLSRALTDGGSPEEVSALTEFAVRNRKHPLGQQAFAILARVAAGEGEREQALTLHLKANIHGSPLEDYLLLERGDLARAAKDWNTATIAYEALYQNFPNSPYRLSGLLRLALTQAAAGNSQWRETLQRLQREYPSTPEAMSARVELLLASGDPARLSEGIITLLEDAPNLNNEHFSRVIRRLEQLRKSKAWSPTPAQSRRLHAVQREAHRLGHTKRLLQLDAVYATAQLTAEQRQWSVALHALGRLNKRERAEATKILDRLSASGTLNPEVQALVHSMRTSIAFFANEYPQVERHAAAYLKGKPKGAEAEVAYRYWCWARRELKRPYDELAGKMLKEFPASERTAAVFLDLVLDHYEAGEFTEVVATCKLYQKQATPPGRSYTEQFTFWQGRSLLAAGNTEDGLALLRTLTGYDTYGCWARELLAEQDGKQLVSYVSAQVEPDLSGLPKGWDPEMLLWYRSGAEPNATAYASRIALWREHTAFARFQVAAQQLIPDLIHREGSILVEAFPDDDGLRFWVAMQAGHAGERFRKAVHLYAVARSRENKGQHLRSPLFWREVFPDHYREIIAYAAQQNRVDRLLIHSLIMQESTYQLSAISSVGARGLMQLMPPTARRVAKAANIPYSPDKITEPKTNMLLGTAYIRMLLEMFQENPIPVLAGYNAGENKSKEWLERFDISDPFVFTERITYAESQGYVKRILRNYQFYTALYGEQHYQSYWTGKRYAFVPHQLASDVAEAQEAGASER